MREVVTGRGGREGLEKRCRVSCGRDDGDRSLYERGQEVRYSQSGVTCTLTSWL